MAVILDPYADDTSITIGLNPNNTDTGLIIPFKEEPEYFTRISMEHSSEKLKLRLRYAITHLSSSKNTPNFYNKLYIKIK